jgi:hypothetical protein
VAKLARILKTEMSGDLRALAELLQSKGRGKDTILAHITPAEAKRLKSAGGRGSRNPDTGLLEFDTTPADVGSLPEVTVSAPADTSSAAPAYDPGQFAASAPASSSSAGASGGGDYTGIPYTPAAGGGAQGGFPSTQPYSISGDLTPPDLVSQPLNLDPNLQAQLLQPDAQPTDEPAKQNFLQRALGKLSSQDLARLGIAGVGGLAGLVQSRKAAGQIGAAQQEQQALAAPYQQQGRALTQAAAAGQLSPASAQAYEAARAQMQQQAAQRGGVGVEQMASQLEGFRQQLLAKQYELGIQISGIGDNIAIGAIRTGMQLDAQLGQANQAFYTSLAAIAAGVPLRTT